MSDAPVETAAPVEAAPAADTAPAAAPAAAPAPEATAPAAAPAVEADPFDGDLSDEQVFSRGYVEKLRKQGQTYREQANERAEALSQYEDVYGQYEADDKAAWFEIASEYARDPRSGAEMMRRIADAVLEDGSTPEEAAEKVQAEDAVTEEAAEQGVNLTPEQVDEIVTQKLNAKEAEQAQEQAIESVFNELRAEGFDPKSRDGHSVLWTANNETGGDIAKAIEIVKAEKQAIIDAYVAEKAGTPTSRTAPSDGMLASPAPEVQNLDDAFKAANAFLDGMSSQPG